MKAIIENNKTYKVTGERGDFYITEDNRGKCKMFAKRNVEAVEIEDMPKAKTYRQSKSSKPNYDITKSLILSELNNRSNANYILSKIEEVTEATDIVKSICEYANRHAGQISEKQAWVLAKFMDDNNIKF